MAWPRAGVTVLLAVLLHPNISVVRPGQVQAAAGARGWTASAEDGATSDTEVYSSGKAAWGSVTTSYQSQSFAGPQSESVTASSLSESIATSHQSESNLTTLQPASVMTSLLSESTITSPLSESIQTSPQCIHQSESVTFSPQPESLLTSYQPESLLTSPQPEPLLTSYKYDSLQTSPRSESPAVSMSTSMATRLHTSSAVSLEASSVVTIASSAAMATGPNAESTTSFTSEFITTAHMTESVSDPLSESVRSGPLSESATSGPLSESATSGPLSESATSGPLSESATSGPLSESAASGPLSESATSGPLSESATSGPPSESATSGPLSESATSGPPSESATSGLLSESATSGPLSESATSGPLSESATSGPLSESATSGPLSESATSLPLSESATYVPLSASLTTSRQTELTTVSWSESITIIPRSESFEDLRPCDSITLTPPATPKSANSTHGLCLRDHTPLPQQDERTSHTLAISGPTTADTSATRQDVRTLHTFGDGQYMKVNQDGSVSFSHDRNFSISMSDCSLKDYFDSYAVLGDLSVYEMLVLTAGDTEPCAWRLGSRWSDDGSSYVPHYIRQANITFNSSDAPFHTNRPVDESASAFCFLLRTPPHTSLAIYMNLEADEIQCSQCVAVEVSSVAGGRHQHILRDQHRLADVARLTIHSNTVLVMVKGLHEAFQQSVGSLVVSMRALPTCLKPRLDVKYPKRNKTGRIQTPRWDGQRPYSHHMDSCMTVPVPANHSIMVSFVSFHLEERCDCDFVEIFLTHACSGTPRETLCHTAGPEPTLYEAEYLSVRFHSDRIRRATGFRLLFSFHHTSQLPQRLDSGKWECAVPDPSVLLQHFACSPHTYCEGGEDRTTDGCPSADLCGPNIIVLGDGCYRHVSPSRQVSWEEAEDTCKSNHGHLASLNTQREWLLVRGWMNDTHQLDSKHTFVGLRLSTFSLQNAYSSLWQWSDNTTALYYNISYCCRMLAPYCAAFHQSVQHLSVIQCDDLLYADFLCEIPTETSGHSGLDVVLTEPETPASSLPGMVECHDHSVTRHFLDCGGRGGVRGAAATEACPHNTWDEGSLWFPCRDYGGCVPYTLLCDHRRDCPGGGDEDFCSFQACSSSQFHCQDGRQCLPLQSRCDGVEQCVDGSDELKCRTSLEGDWVSSLPPPPSIINLTSTGTLTVDPWTSTCPDTHFQCPGEAYCLPVYVRCNTVRDCPGREDEQGCDRYTCPGFYRCRNSPVCVHADHVCDGVFQCPEHDDELTCGMACPDNCQCHGHAFVCTGKFPAENYPELRYLNADGTGMKPQDVSSNTLLVHLSLKNCNISDISTVHLPNLRSLDLGHNVLTKFSGFELMNMKSLRNLVLASNTHLMLNFDNHTNIHFPNMVSIDFSDTNLQEISSTLLRPFPNLQHLNLSGNAIQKLSPQGFSNLRQLKVVDITGSPMTDFPRDIFANMESIKTIMVDNYKLCCRTVLPRGFEPTNCHAPADEISSCAALLRADIFRVFLAAYSFLALVGNLASFMYRVCSKRGARKQLGFDVFVTHLCASDFFMGVYLAIIGVADRLYYGSYEWNDRKWMHSITCQAAGFLSLLSSEVSAFLICLITLERCLVVRFPLRDLRFSVKLAQGLSVGGWVVGVVLAAVPLLPFTQHWQFYSKTGICIPLPITRRTFPGSDYSFFVMIVSNFVLFLLIAVGQLLIYTSYRSHSKAISGHGRRNKDMTLARRLLIVAMSDFLCWFPIGLLGLMARSDIPIPGEANVAMAIFVLPFNSAVNPCLYTLHMVRENRRQTRKASQASGKELTSVVCTSRSTPIQLAKVRHDRSTQTDRCSLAEQYGSDMW